MGAYDISRVNFDPKKHYTSVRMQQGRVLTDDDYNEDNRIHEEDQRRILLDVIGPFGSPDSGFKIDNLRVDSGLVNFDIMAGILYVGGLRLQLDSPETFRLQKDWLQQAPDIDKLPEFNTPERYDLVYIEAWQQAVSAVEDDSLFEVALGGPDTTTRLRTMRRVHIAGNLDYCDCADAWHQLITNWTTGDLGQINTEYERVPDAKLKVSYSDTGLPEDLCKPTAAGGYLGAENQAIRVQLINKTSFTWGFDNASPLYRVTVSRDGKTVHMLTGPKDQYHWPLTNQVVEILAWSAVLPNGEKLAEQTGHLSKVEASFNPDSGDFTLQDSLPATFGTAWHSRADKEDLNDQTPPEYYYLRVWNRGNDLDSNPGINFTPGTAVALGHTGLEVTLTGSDFVSADYWVIAARPETPDQVVPWELEKGLPPNGVRRFFAPLAVIRWSNFAEEVQGKIIHDCRKKFNPLTEQDCCCTYSVGDGIKTKGDFNSIQEAIDSLPGAGGKICVLPGEHVANVSIVARRQIRISGCGDQTLIRPGPDLLTTPIFMISSSQKIQIENLTLVAVEGTAIEVRDPQHSKDAQNSRIASEKITITGNNIVALVHAIKVHVDEERGGDNRITISFNHIGMVDKPEGLPAIFSIADAVLIERNKIVVVPAPTREDPDDPRNPDDPNDRDPFDPCADPRLTYRRGFSSKYQIYRLLRYVAIYRPTGRFKKGYAAMGGIQIGGTSEQVRILENEIIGGRGNGITLGHLASAEENQKFKKSFSYQDTGYTYSSLYGISIENNLVVQMGLSGISALLNFRGNESFVHVDDFNIYRNTIQHCALQIPEVPSKLVIAAAFGGVILGDCEGGRIQENRIEYNGRSVGEAICGIFVFHGEKIDISTNSIINNGAATEDANRNLRPGPRGGIVVRMSFKAPVFKNIFTTTVPSFDGIPAVKVHDNIVNQPIGHALFLMAFGPVSVVSNQFTSLQRDTGNPLSLLATTVFILDLGVSKDMLIIGFKNMANTDPKAYQKMLADPKFQQVLRALQYLPSGKIMFADNQVTLDMRAATRNLAISSQLIASLDDVAYNNNQSECAGFISFAEGANSSDIVLFNSMLFGASIRSNDNRFLDGLTFTLYSLLSYGFMNTATGNQASHCIIALGNMRAIGSNLILNNDLCKDKKQMIGTSLGVPAGSDA